MNRLVRNKFDSGEKQTEGINITQWGVKLNNKEDVRLHIWDFGGQEIMHSTHQFFFTQRSLYLLVLNGRQGHEDRDAEYWLNLIKSFGGDSPVIIVMNKIIELKFDVNRRYLQEKFPKICGFIETDCEDGTGIEELRQRIIFETDRLEHLRDAFPASWSAIKNRLAGMKENYLTLEQYHDVCTKNGESDRKGQDYLAYHLHNLGIALNYMDDPRLRDMHILNPQWVTNGIYAIINSKKVGKQDGVLYLDDLKEILDQTDYPPERHCFILDLMRKFDLSFRFPDGEERYLVADLLDKQQPSEEDEFRLEECLNFQYHYPVMPEGLLPRFIVRTHVLSTDKPRWRTGVILEFGENIALIKADTVDKKVHVSIKGNLSSRKELLAVIRSHFANINGNFKFEPKEMVPVPNDPEEFVPYDDLKVMEKDGVEILPKAIKCKTVYLKVRDLLNGVDFERKKDMERETSKALKLFYSYSHKDERMRDELETHLTLMQSQGLIESWHDRRITAGDEWKKDINENLRRADIILLLISADFLVSKYCSEIEGKLALERHKKGEAVAIPIIIREVDWTSAPLGKLQALPRDGKPVWRSSKGARDKAWAEVAKGIKKVIEERKP